MTVTSRDERNGFLVVDRKKFGTELIKKLVLSVEKFKTLISVLETAAAFEVLGNLPESPVRADRERCLNSKSLFVRVTPFLDRIEKDFPVNQRQPVHTYHSARSLVPPSVNSPTPVTPRPVPSRLLPLQASPSDSNAPGRSYNGRSVKRKRLSGSPTSSRKRS
jgi:hypothetical protein